MLKRYEITKIEQKVNLSGALEQDVLVLISNIEKSKFMFLFSDCTEKGLAEMRSLFRQTGDGQEIRIICPNLDKPKILSLISNIKYADLRFATFDRRGQWVFDYEKARLKFLANEKIRVLIVDDSKPIRMILEKIFSADEQLEIVGSLADPTQVESQLKVLKPDVMTLDIHMPKLTGVELLRRIMPIQPIPTVMVSSVGIEDGREVLTALELGAVDYIQKPSFEDLDKVAPVLIEKIKTAATVDVRTKFGIKRKLSANKINLDVANIDRRKVICIGSSTGGTEAIRQIFRSMPKQFPPILITQHIPKLFSLAFAESLRREFSIEVFEAVDGQEILPNQVLIAPGGLQMEIVNGASGAMKVRVFDGAPVNRHKPSVDVLFNSAAKSFGKHAVGVILTGMGSDGAKGLKAMKEMGSATVAQDEETSVVYGMPRVAKELGGVDRVLPIDEIAAAMIDGCRIRQTV